jgi:hypothetical protein
VLSTSAAKATGVDFSGRNNDDDRLAAAIDARPAGLFFRRSGRPAPGFCERSSVGSSSAEVDLRRCPRSQRFCMIAT